MSQFLSDSSPVSSSRLLDTESQYDRMNLFSTMKEREKSFILRVSAFHVMAGGLLERSRPSVCLLVTVYG